MKNTPNPKLYYLILLAILISVVVIYYPVLNAYFIVDDFMWINVVGDKGWQAIPSFFTDVREVGFFRPLVKLAFWLDYSLYGLNQTGYHLSNLMLHIGNILLVFVLGCILSRNKGVTALATLIFALHPMHTECIAYISGRTELIHALFYLACLICFIKYLEAGGGNGLYYASLAAFTLSLLTKETAVTLVLVLFLSELWFKAKRGRQGKLLENWSRYMPYLLILASYIILRQLVIKATVYPIRWDDIWYRPIYYFVRVFAPINMQTFIFRDILVSISQSFILSLLVGLLFVFIIYGAYHYLYKDLEEYKPLLLYCLLWIAITYFPVYFNPGERYAYLPSIGSSMIWALIISRGVQKIRLHSVAGAYIALGVVVMGIISFSYIRISERNAVFFKVGEIARRAVSQLLMLRPEMPRGATLYFINPPERWIRESEIWTRPFYTTFDDAVQISYHDPSLKIHYEVDNYLDKMADKASFLLKRGFREEAERNGENIFVFEYQAGGLTERTDEFRRLLLNRSLPKSRRRG
jgi:hypothetical protein